MNLKKGVISAKAVPVKEKACPYCAERILLDAVKCRHCGEWLNGSRPGASEPASSSLPARKKTARPQTAPSGLSLSASRTRTTNRSAEILEAAAQNLPVQRPRGEKPPALPAELTMENPPEEERRRNLDDLDNFFCIDCKSIYLEKQEFCPDCNSLYVVRMVPDQRGLDPNKYEMTGKNGGPRLLEAPPTPLLPKPKEVITPAQRRSRNFLWIIALAAVLWFDILTSDNYTGPFWGMVGFMAGHILPLFIIGLALTLIWRLAAPVAIHKGARRWNWSFWPNMTAAMSLVVLVVLVAGSGHMLDQYSRYSPWVDRAEAAQPKNPPGDLLAPPTKRMVAALGPAKIQAMANALKESPQEKFNRLRQKNKSELSGFERGVRRGWAQLRGHAWGMLGAVGWILDEPEMMELGFGRYQDLRREARSYPR